jgi:hypothetical protein
MQLESKYSEEMLLNLDIERLKGEGGWREPYWLANEGSTGEPPSFPGAPTSMSYTGPPAGLSPGLYAAIEAVTPSF